MPDAYEAIRSLPFSVVGPALGADLGLFKVREQGREYYGPCLVHKPKNNQTSFSYQNDGLFNCGSRAPPKATARVSPRIRELAVMSGRPALASSRPPVVDRRLDC